MSARILDVLSPSALALVTVAVTLVCHGSYRGVAGTVGSRQGTPPRSGRESPRPETVTLSTGQALLFPLVASVILLAIFFYFGAVHIVLVIVMAITGFTCASFVAQPLIRGALCRLSKAWGPSSTLPSQAPPLSSAPLSPGARFEPLVRVSLCGLLVLSWLVTDHWLVMDALACCMAVTVIATLRVPSLKVAFLVLTGLLVYDFFWVFVSPYLFGDNVMVAAATKAATNPVQRAAEALHLPGASWITPRLDIPNKIMVPQLSSLFSNSSSGVHFYMLGLGDIILPGLAVCLALALDGNSRKRSDGEGRWDGNGLWVGEWRTLHYYKGATAAYACGLLAAFLSSIAFHAAQPALVYISPAVLGTLIAQAWRRGELQEVWDHGAGTGDGDAPGYELVGRTAEP